MAGSKVPLSAIKTIDEVVADPHIAARGMIVNVPVGDRQVAMMGMPIKLSNGPAEPHAAAPALGEHNEVVFRALLELEDADIAALGRGSGAS
jgi:CoA:oxalate CoA-transferase